MPLCCHTLNTVLPQRAAATCCVSISLCDARVVTLTRARPRPQYLRVADLEADLELMFSNCRTFNEVSPFTIY